MLISVKLNSCSDLFVLENRSPSNPPLQPVQNGPTDLHWDHTGVYAYVQVTLQVCVAEGVHMDPQL